MWNNLQHVVHGSASFLRGDWVWRGICLVALCAGLYVGTNLAVQTRFESLGPEQWDKSVYWVMGRGILNGLVPYEDLYEEKPPGIYLITALSLFLGGDMRIGHWLQALAIAGIGLVPVLYFVRLLWKEWTVQNLTIVGCALGAFGLLAIFTSEYAGAFQTESFGAFFGVLYLMAIADPERRYPGKFLCATLALFASVGIKEPFVLSLAGVALLLSPTPRYFLHMFIQPLITAAISGVVLLYALGWMKPYVIVYLQEMFVYRVSSDGSIWTRPFIQGRVSNFFRIWYEHNAALFLGVLFALVGSFGVVVRRAGRWKYLPWHVVRFAGSAALAMVVLYIGGKYHYGHHYVFVVPIPAAILWLGFKHMYEVRHLAKGWWLAVVATVLLVAAAWPLPYVSARDLMTEIRGAQSWVANSRRTAESVDALLDACNLDRYLYLGGLGPNPAAYTRHSPIGPVFVQISLLYTGERPHREALPKQLAAAEVIVRGTRPEFYDLHAMVDEYIAENFTTEPWPCAAPYAEFPDYTVYFRKR